MKNTKKERLLIGIISLLFLTMTLFIDKEWVWLPWALYGFCLGLIMGDEEQ